MNTSERMTRRIRQAYRVDKHNDHEAPLAQWGANNVHRIMPADMRSRGAPLPWSAWVGFVVIAAAYAAAVWLGALGR